MNDTIAAIATPSGRGGVGIVRVSGAKCKDICQYITAKQPKPRLATYSPFLDANGKQIDQGLSIYFNAPKSFTGEDVLELHAHGGPIVLDMLLRRVLELGARIARAGEFSERAFINNKIDLIQAEAIAELISANSEEAAIAAMRSLQGEFSQKINNLVESLIALRIYVEAAIDFPDEEIDFLADQHVNSTLNNLIAQLEAIHTQAKHGVLLSEGINAVIVGEPNAGKSTLLNNLTGEETAIVTPIAGTTRDTIKATVNLDGVTLNVVDTAGLRETVDFVEQEGIKRAFRAIELADVVLLMVDVDLIQESDIQRLNIFELNELYSTLKNKIRSSAKIVVIANKIDKKNMQPAIYKTQYHSMVTLSAQSGDGLDLLREHIKEIVGMHATTDGGAFLARRRHLDALLRAHDCIVSGQKQLCNNRAGELLADELKHAQLALSEITGEFTSDDLLGRIFSEFCIGK